MTPLERAAHLGSPFGLAVADFEKAVAEIFASGVLQEIARQIVDVGARMQAMIDAALEEG